MADAHDDKTVGQRFLQAVDHWLCEGDDEVEMGAILRDARPELYDEILRKEVTRWDCPTT